MTSDATPPRAADLFSLAGRVALVTGAGAGLGARFAAVLAANGARVCVTDRDGDAAARVAASLPGALALPLDVTDPASIATAFAAAEGTLGVVDVLVANAGIVGMGRATTLPEADWRRVMDVNLDGAFRVAQAASARMIAADKPGSIIAIASVLGVGTSKGVLAYTVSKAGVVQLTKALAAELGPAGIRVNALAPGYVPTALAGDFTASASGRNLKRRLPLKRFGRPDDLDGPLLLLASDASRYMTGTVLVVDGGQLLAV